MSIFKKGLSLLEILLVLTTMTVFVGICILVIDPSRQWADKRNLIRRTDVNVILNAIYQYALDNRGTLPVAISTTPAFICQTVTSDCLGLVSLSELTVKEKYLISIPIDPNFASGSTSTTGYKIYKSDDNHLTVEAVFAEKGEVIKITR